MVIVYATHDDETPSSVRWWEVQRDGSPATSVRITNGTVHAYSQLLYVDVMLLHPAVGTPDLDVDVMRGMQDNPDAPTDKNHHKSPIEAPTRPDGGPADGVAYGIGEYTNPRMYYDSPMLHTVRLGGLRGGATYKYIVEGDAREFAFSMPPGEGDAGDAGSGSSGRRGGDGGGQDVYPFMLGLTADVGQTAASEANMALMYRQLVAFGEKGDGLGHGLGRGLVLLAGDLSYADGWGDRWDSFGRMMEPLASRFPVLTSGGNHEVTTAEAWVGYNARYPMPHASSGSPSNLWWSRDAGPVHIISLCSYAGARPGSLQHRWLLRDLSKVDRRRTPWVVVMMHVPWYHSSTEHQNEAASMRGHMEGALYEHGVDIILAGHVHAYERSVPMAFGVPHPCGAVHLTLGDGGNREGVSLPWLEPAPAWSAMREASFGIASLVVVNATHAVYNWTRSSCEQGGADGRLAFDASSCQSEALGPWDHGADDPDRPSADPIWIVRNAERSPRLAGCPEPGGATDGIVAAAAVSGSARVSSGRAEGAGDAKGVGATAPGAGARAEPVGTVAAMAVGGLEGGGPVVRLCHSAICGGTSPRPRPAWHDPESNITDEADEGEEGEEGEDPGDPEPSEGPLPLMGWILFLSSGVAVVAAWHIIRRAAWREAAYRAAMEDELNYVRVEGTRL